MYFTITSVGDTGTASPLLMLLTAIENSNAGDNIIAASYGNGSEALFKVTEAGKRGNSGRFESLLSSRIEIQNYEKYLVMRGILPVERGPRGEVAPTSLPLLWRQRRELLGLVGTQCVRCGTPQYPAQRVCVNPDCRTVDQMVPYRFADKKGRLFSFTEDRLAFSVIPPQTYGVIDFDGGGRYVFDITDCEPERLRLGMGMEMAFRRRYVDDARGITGYGWKAVPGEKDGGKVSHG
ncbi:MAG: OB-fold domain-containing protein [Chloroflexi bacterium]|nr:OB-fold domain-containing protein [Chloroflexota bacterium]